MHTATMKKFLKILLVSMMIFAVVLTCGGLIAFQSITKNAVFDSTLMPKNEITTVFSDINGNKDLRIHSRNTLNCPITLKTPLSPLKTKGFINIKESIR